MATNIGLSYGGVSKVDHSNICLSVQLKQDKLHFNLKILYSLLPEP